MVVAEIPLWLVHSSGSKISDPNVSPTDDTQTLRAQESLALLETVGGGAKKCAIYSVDVHPEGLKFATGGGDGAVRIWSTSALFAKYSGSFSEGGAYESSDSSGASGASGDEESPPHPLHDDAAAPTEERIEVHDLNQLVRRKKDGQTPAKAPAAAKPVPSPTRQKRESVTSHRLLCTLSAHTGSSVLAVRFSTSGQYLASAGDDAVVCVYAPSSSSIVGGNLSENVEHWSRIKLCRGHTLDVVGLAWAPDDSHLVSCSLDSDAPIIVWKLTDLGSQERRTQANVLCNPYKILGKGVHTSTVKGVTFDPAGSYIASSGDDPAVCIWRAHDDWGLEKRIDADDGIFRKWKDVQELTGQTLFRRLSWSTDGSYICSTNSSVKNKHVASTISRDGWRVSGAKTAASGAANLVGHKQPVVVSQHCPYLLNARKGEENGENDDDNEPDYATLVALGDKRGFVTVWSTRKSRPIFKLQCSESRCTVTDLSWGRSPGSIILLVAMLDGHVVAIKFSVPDEVGPLLSDTEQKRVFQLRYGIDFEEDNGRHRGSMFVGDNATPKLIENALQFTLEDNDEDIDGGNDDVEDEGAESDPPPSAIMSPSKVKAAQVESKSKGKKRIRPVLMAVDTSKRQKPNGDSGDAKQKKKVEGVQDMLDLAAKAIADVGPTSKSESMDQPTPSASREPVPTPHSTQKQTSINTTRNLNFTRIPHSTERILSVELSSGHTDVSTSFENGERLKIIADCTNSNRVPQGSSGQPLACVMVSISRGGIKLWKDEIIGTSCTALASCETSLAIGTADGCLYLYGTSPSLGWSSGFAFRSHPPFILGHAIVSIQMNELKKEDSKAVEIVVVAADGMFAVYSILPNLSLKFKGTILPAMTHMVLATCSNTSLPKLARVQMTENGHLFMILSLSPPKEQENRPRSGNASNPSNPGGSLQAFVYDRGLELWVRISDSRFLLSDFYSTLPSSNSKHRGELSKMDDAVRTGASASSLRQSRRAKATGEGHAAYMYNEDGNFISTRSHCEDRMACALALGSSIEFHYWLSQYVKNLVACGNESQLRMLVDMLLSSRDGISNSTWWLSSSPTILSLNRKNLVKTVVIPEMSKNRALQRLTNEVALEVETSN
ncbi:TUP1-like enhancer of split [Fragilaria crotonensis]|nr:TUP1-like enhancer of split [Fragilaria crotonensis]